MDSYMSRKGQLLLEATASASDAEFCRLSIGSEAIAPMVAEWLDVFS